MGIAADLPIPAAHCGKVVQCSRAPLGGLGGAPDAPGRQVAGDIGGIECQAGKSAKPVVQPGHYPGAGHATASQNPIVSFAGALIATAPPP